MAPSLESFRVGALHRLGVALDSLPSGLVTRVVGTSRDVDDQRLDPNLAAILLVAERVTAQTPTATVAERRAQLRTDSRIAAGLPISVGAVRDLTVAGAEGPLRARLYQSGSGIPGRPLVVYLHGGGWVVGDLDTHDQPCRLLSRYADVNVLAIDYRLAPEHPFPAAVDDAVAAFAWATQNAVELGADPDRVAVAGDSAGGNLAAVVAQQTRLSGVAAPVAQLLIYPGTDSSVDRPSKELFSHGYFLDTEQMDWYVERYCPGVPDTDPRLSPLCADDFGGLPPAVVAVAAFDPLRDEGTAYAVALRGAGVPVVLRRGSGLVHGYFGMTGINRASLQESLAVAGAFGALLDTV